MKGINFIQLGVLEDEEVDSGKDYVIPFAAELGKGWKMVNYLKLKNGRLFFGRSDSSHKEYQSSNHSHFFRIAERPKNRASRVRFPTTQKKEAGWRYGHPRWFFG